MSIYDVSNKLVQAGIGHVIVAAEGDKIKVTTKLTFPKTAESMKIIETENGVLRGNTFLDNPTKLRICNAYARTLERVRIYRNFPQRPGLDITFRFRIPGPGPKPARSLLQRSGLSPFRIPGGRNFGPHLPRVTVNPRLLEAAPVLVVTWGAAKAEALGHVFGEVRDERRWPVQRARRTGAVWFVDEAAAADIPAQPGT